MDDLSELLLVLAVIYAIECLVWIRLGTVAFSRWTGSRWRMRQPGSLAGNARGGLLLAHPLPPLGLLVYGQQAPLSVSLEGVCAWTTACVNGSRRPPHTGAHVPIEEIRKTATDGKWLLVNGRKFLKATSEDYARFLAAMFLELRQLPGDRREKWIRAGLERQLDTKQVEARLEDCLRRARPLRMLGNTLLFYLFAVVPVAAWHFGLIPSGLWLLGGMLLQTVPVMVLFHRAHKVLLPGACDERFAWDLTLILAAPAAIRASDILARRAFERFHPLALAKVLCAPEDFRALALTVARDLAHPLQPATPQSMPEAARATVTWAGDAWRDTVAAFLRDSGVKGDEWLADPARTESCHASYCPRCLAQYVKPEGLCEDCGGVRLKPFPTPATR